MASKVKKGFLYYILWLVFIVLGVFCVFGSILIFNPGKDVFGWGLRWISDTRQTEYQKVNDTWFANCSIDTVEVNSGFTSFNVIRTVDYKSVTFVLKKNIVGFSTHKTNFTYSTNLSLDGTKLKIDITEPEMSLPLGANATLTMYCPTEMNLDNYSFIVNTTSGSTTFGRNNYEFGLNVSKIDITSKTGAVSIQNNVTINSGTLNINTEKSEINIYNNISGFLNITSKTSKINIPNISGSVNVEADEIKFDAGTILGNAKFSSAKGYIKIDTLGQQSNPASGNLTTEIDKTVIANIIVKTMYGNLTLPSAGASTITVDNLYGQALVETTSGDVTFGDVKDNIYITTNSGSVTFNQTSATAVANVSTNSGKINATFNGINTATLASTKGAININVKNGLLWKLNYIADNGINVSWITTSLEKQGTILAPNASDSETKTITATTSGKISVSNFQ